MREYIVVIGGYGHVGQTICRELGELYPGKVYAAGRSVERAEQFTRTTDGKVKPLQIHLKDGFDLNFTKRVKLVVMCLDQTDTAFVSFCFTNKIHYVDVSANGSFLTQVEDLQSEARANGITAILSIGLAPGLTNLMSLHAKNLMDQVNNIDISIMLGLGDQHGKAAIEWTVDNLGMNFDVVKEGKKVTAASFTDAIKTDFGAPFGYRKAYRFNFSDQHVLPHTLGVPSVSTRLCFDSSAATGLLAWLRVTGIFRLLKLKPIRKAAVQLFGKMRFGKDIYAVKIDALGKKDQKDIKVESFLQGRNEARITSMVAASVAGFVYRSELPYGVYHIEQLFDLDSIMQSISQEATYETRVSVS
ncbi:saccharopine dehydrogenase family protein [Cohnella sp. WQ 127256]|uniref:saccharopine dehydrogenase family protein n=1 Tax=Cohnella sp. WQ 127256 TaxID=2938790 RepID=UPI00211945C3|nr:saccharopine dehydrogenase NADP-binding domain-containing protein [Cohnella sp. WQ 127256]